MKPILCAAALCLPAVLPAQSAASGYRVGIVSESGDIVSWFTAGTGAGAGTLVAHHVVPVGIMPADIDGPHNLAVSPDGQFYYVSIAHGTPFGSLWKIDAKIDTLVGRAPLEMFPTTIGLTPDGELAFVANSDFHGDHPRMNVVSVVHTPTMTTLTSLPACDMPHGVKSNHAGTSVYISCMMSDELLEIEVGTFRIIRRAKTGVGHTYAGMAGMDHGSMNHGAPAPSPAAAATTPPAPDGECGPTFVAVSPDDRTLYAACNHSGSLQVWDAATLTKSKEIPVGAGAYNVEPSPDGRWVIVTNKKAQSFSLIDAQSLTEVVRLPTTKKIVHGVAWSPDGRYAYVSQESIGADPGAIDVFDLVSRKVISTIPVPAQPTGVSILRT